MLQNQNRGNLVKNNLINEDYKEFIGKIKNKISEAMKAVNKTLINLYWGIGQEIYNQQQEKGWGKSIVEVLAKELKKEFPNVQGFSSRNLWRMRNLYVEYKDKDNEILPPLVAEISWSKKIAIMEKCKDQLQREFYIKMTKKYRDYVSDEKQATFMKPYDVAKTIIDNVINDTNLTIADIIIERN